MKRPSRKMLGALAVLLLLMAAGAALLARKHHALAQAPRYALDPVPVRAATVERGTLTVTRPYVATVEAVRRAELSARHTAEVRDVRWTESDRVTAGETGLVLDDRDLAQQWTAAEARMAEAEAEWQLRKMHLETLERSVAFWEAEAARIRVLADDNHLSVSEAAAMEERLNEVQGQRHIAEQQVAVLRQRVESLRANREEMATRLEFARLKAPFDGVVSKRFVDPGDLATPGKPLLVIEDTSELRLAFDLPQSDLPDMRLGMEAVVRIGDEAYRRPITNIHPTLNDQRMARVWIEAGDTWNDRVRIGQYLPVSLIVETLEDVAIIPRAAVVEQAGREPYVYVIEADRLAARAVTIRGRSEDRVAVTGVEPGEQVVRYTYMDWARISEGRRVAVWP